MVRLVIACVVAVRFCSFRRHRSQEDGHARHGTISRTSAVRDGTISRASAVRDGTMFWQRGRTRRVDPGAVARVEEG